MNLSSYDEFDEEDVTDLSTVNSTLKHARKSSETQQVSVSADVSGTDTDISSKIEAAKSIISNKRITRVSSSDARSTIRDLSSMVSSTATAARSRSMDATQSPSSGAAATSGAPAKRKRRGTDYNQQICPSNLTISTSPTPPSSIDESSLLSSSLDSHNTDDDHDVSTASANHNEINDVEFNDDPLQSDDLDHIEDEFSAEQGPLQSPNKVLNIVLASPSKLPVMEKYTANKSAVSTSITTPPTSVSSIETASSSIASGRGSLESTPSPSRRLVFGLHSPVCKDEIIRPDMNKVEVINKDLKKELNKGLNKEKNNRVEENKNRGVVTPNAPTVKPKAASRTKSRVISSEDAIKAMDAIIDIQVRCFFFL